LYHPVVCRPGERGSRERAGHSELKKSETIDGADELGLAHPTIAVARDEAFSFYYDETFDLFERLGARLAFFSPLHDSSLPADACGLYVGGGYPELHARELSENTAMVNAVRMAIEDGMPTIAECGGFLYLHEELEDAEGTYWPLVGVVPGRAYKTDRLRRFGYITLTARRDGLLARTGEQLRAHEFHYWDSDDPGDAFHAQKPQSARSWDCVISTPTLYAGFPHLYLAGQPEVARRFVGACAAYGSGNRQQVRREGVS
jgi:cobyrinic acid a,c-diamide synthase